MKKIVKEINSILKNTKDVFNREYEELKEFCITNKSNVFITIFFAIATYGFLLSNFIIGVDSDRAVAGGGINLRGFLAQGRFMVALSRKLFYSLEIVPFIGSFLGMTLMIISSIYLIKNLNHIIKRNDKIPTLVFMCLFITMPFVMHWMYFKTYDFDLCFGYIYTAIAISCVSKYVINKESKLTALIGIIFMTFSIGVYQSFVTVNVILLFTVYILYTITKEDISFKESFMILFKFMLILGISIILFFAIVKATHILIVPSDNYLEGFIQIGKRDTEQYLTAVKQRFTDLFIDAHYTGTNALRVTFGLAILLICINFIKFKPHKILNNLCMAFMFICPVILSVAIFTLMPFRTHQDVVIISSVIWYIFYYAVIDKIKFKYVNVIFLLIALYVSFYQAHDANKIIYVNYLRYEQDLFVADKIASDIYDLDLVNIKGYPVVYLGNKDIEQNVSITKETRGWMEANNEFSNFYWYYRDSGAISTFVTARGHNFLGASQEQLKNAVNLGINMPSYPTPGYVQEKEGIIIIKLSEYTIQEYIKE